MGRYSSILSWVSQHYSHEHILPSRPGCPTTAHCHCHASSGPSYSLSTPLCLSQRQLHASHEADLSWLPLWLLLFITVALHVCLLQIKPALWAFSHRTWNATGSHKSWRLCHLLEQVFQILTYAFGQCPRFLFLFSVPAWGWRPSSTIALFSNWAMKLTESREYISSVHSYIPAGTMAFDRHSVKIELTDLS